MPKKAIRKKTLVCAKCGMTKRASYENYYKSSSPLYEATGFVNVCKDCLNSLYLDFIKDIRNDRDALIEMCKLIDKPFIESLYQGQKKKVGSKSVALGDFLRCVNMKQWTERGTVRFEHSEFDVVHPVDRQVDMEVFLALEEGFNVAHLKELYGNGYPDPEYILFEKKYQQLKPSFQLATTMHEECLREYCVNKVKETLAKAKGDFKQAKEWAGMAKDVAEAGKLKPSQMSKADLSMGLNGFGEMTRMVEQEVDIIPILPRFIEKPKDKVDIVLWYMINYIRDLKGLPEAEYKDIWAFYEKRREDYEKNMLDYELMAEQQELRESEEVESEEDGESSELSE